MRVQGWQPGSRLKRLHASHSYGYLLLVIVVTYVVFVAAPDDDITRAALVLVESGTLALALWTSGLGWQGPTVILMCFAVAAAAVQIAVGGTAVTGLIQLVNIGLVATTMLVVGLGVFDQGEINRQSVGGAVCIYLFLGILFTFFYGALAELGSGTFFAQGTDGTPATRIYFSYVTLATLGYGDYTAAGQPGRSLAIAEALLGQLYLVTVVALLVGRLGQRRREPV